MELSGTPGLAIGPIKRLFLNHAQWELMRAHVAAVLPFEACGLLAGQNDTVHEVLPITNHLRSSTRFRMEPGEQVRAFAAIEANGMALLGVFHSHPAPPGTAGAPTAGPSATDIAEATYPVVHVLWSRAKGPWEAHGYWIADKHVSDVVLQITDLK